MANASIKVQRVYKNSAEEVLRIDTIWISGNLVKTKAWKFGQRDITTRNGYPVQDYGEFKFHANPARVDVEIFQTTTSRTVAEVEMIGTWSTLGPAPDYEYFDWQWGRVMIDYLPGVGDAV
jgi:hypothetical protein